MPYKTVEQAEKKNKGLTKYSAKAKRAWLSSFNSSMEKDGDESKAFAIAYSVANKIDGKQASSSAEKVLSNIVSRHWKDGWRIKFDENLVTVKLIGEVIGGRGVIMDYNGQETMSGQRDREQKEKMKRASNAIARDAKRAFNLEEIDVLADGVFLVSDDFFGVRSKVLKKANMALRMQTQKTLSKGRGDSRRDEARRKNEQRRKQVLKEQAKEQKRKEKEKAKEQKERAKAELKKYKEEHPGTKKTVMDFVKSIFSFAQEIHACGDDQDCGCGCNGAGTCKVPEVEVEVEAPGVEIEVEVKPRYRSVGEVTHNLISMAKELLATDVEEIGNKRNESEEHEPNE